MKPYIWPPKKKNIYHMSFLQPHPIPSQRSNKDKWEGHLRILHKTMPLSNVSMKVRTELDILVCGGLVKTVTVSMYLC